ncbi:MAG: hypothetical protein AAB839_01845 [Patescibacteria group bacterium]
MRFRLPNLNRLRIVRDICPLPGFPSHDAFAWKGVAAKSKVPMIAHPNGYTVTDFQNRFITWHRTFTRDHQVPILTSKSFIHIHEWIPPTNPSKVSGYFRFSMNHFEAVAPVTKDPIKHWSTQARRHLAATKKNPALAIRTGTIDEVAAMLPASQVPISLHETFLAFTKRHLAAHSADIEIFIATLRSTPVAAFIAGYCIEAKESTYLVGCFTPDGGKSHAMTALVEKWFQQCAEKNIVHANFGDIVGPTPFPFDDAIGYSNFKTHFGIHRVWMPGSRWRISLAR